MGGDFPNKDTQFKPGQSGNPKGRPVGRRSLSTIVRDLLEDEIDWKLVPIKQADALAEQFGTKAGWEALVLTAFGKALSGDVRAAEWLRKAGYGDKLDLTSGGQQIFQQMDDEQLDQYITKRLAGRRQPSGGADGTAEPQG